jgi:hypothetical protein
MKFEVYGVGSARETRWCGIFHWPHERLRSPGDVNLIALLWTNALSERGQNVWVQMSSSASELVNMQRSFIGQEHLANQKPVTTQSDHGRICRMEVSAASQICTNELEQFCRARSTSGLWEQSLRSTSRGLQC